jgi:hypothetical protein
VRYKVSIQLGDARSATFECHSAADLDKLIAEGAARGFRPEDYSIRAVSGLPAIDSLSVTVSTSPHGGGWPEGELPFRAVAFEAARRLRNRFDVDRSLVRVTLAIDDIRLEPERLRIRADTGTRDATVEARYGNAQIRSGLDGFASAVLDPALAALADLLTARDESEAEVPQAPGPPSAN